ncbi:TPA: hypothetical protein ACH3X1_011432 [Trebouxia sp. C0004]
MDANAPSGDAESADLVDLSKEDSSDKGKKRKPGRRRKWLQQPQQQPQPQHQAEPETFQQQPQDQLMDLDALTSADEFRLAVNEWFGDLDAEDRLAGMENFPAYQDSSAVVKTTLSSLFGSALMPILTEEAASSY